MDANVGQEEAAFSFDLAGRVRNLSLPASAVNALIPLFEAVSNALHAVDTRWGDKATELGKVKVSMIRRDDEAESNVVGFRVSDNGVGLTEANWKSFRTSDSSFKISRGGKGVGRLSWLKAFGGCHVVSHFDENDITHRREFRFSLGTDNPIQGHSLDLLAGTVASGTEVRLEPYATHFEVHCPKKMTTIAAKLVGHFLPYLVIGKLPKVLLEDADGQYVELGDFYGQNQRRNSVDVLELKAGAQAEDQEFHVYHVLLRKNLKFLENGLHWMFYAGNERVAREANIDGQLGLKYVGDDGDCVYVGLVAGPFLDAHVNQERTSFTFGSETAQAIHDKAVASAKTFLSEYIERIRAAQMVTTDKVIRENPQFLPFRERLDDFVSSNLGLNKQDEEEIFLELSRRRLRDKRRLDGQIRSIRDGVGAAGLAESVGNITKALNDEKKGSLAEYVVRRKAILDLLGSSLAYRDSDDPRYFKEEVVHGLIVPLRTSSEDLDYEDHNLWILDDRLAFYAFFRSDKPFSTFVEGAESGREPDIAAVFERSLAFQREGQDEPIVIVEFKRPGRDDYTGNSNPVTQVLEYVDVFRDGKAVKGKDGAIIKPINPATRFICFIVADFTDSLLKVVRTSPANNPTADGQGFFGVSAGHNASVEVMPYAKVLNDARVRNEAFFRHLGLT